jgi:hypothetical protein
MEDIRQRAVLEAVLHRTLAEHPAGVSTRDVYDIIDQSYQFPENWYRQIPESKGYDEILGQGYRDWRDVPQDKLVELVATEPQWQNEIRWARNNLRKRGLLDMSAPTGVWKLSHAGTEAARAGNFGELSPSEQELVNRKRRTKPKSEGKKKSQPQSGVRPDLLVKLALLTKSMPLDDLHLLVEVARAIRKRSLVDENGQ